MFYDQYKHKALQTSKWQCSVFFPLLTSFAPSEHALNKFWMNKPLNFIIFAMHKTPVSIINIDLL